MGTDGDAVIVRLTTHGEAGIDDIHEQGLRLAEVSVADLAALADVAVPWLHALPRAAVAPRPIEVFRPHLAGLPVDPDSLCRALWDEDHRALLCGPSVAAEQARKLELPALSAAEQTDFARFWLRIIADGFVPRQVAAAVAAGSELLVAYTLPYVEDFLEMWDDSSEASRGVDELHLPVVRLLAARLAPDHPLRQRVDAISC
jgi:hypothetical protein